MNYTKYNKELYKITVRDIMEDYSEDSTTLRNIYSNIIEKWREYHGIAGKVRRKKDGKIGWLDLDSNFWLCFYPMKKDGTRSMNTNGYVSENHILDDFEPY